MINPLQTMLFQLQTRLISYKLCFFSYDYAHPVTYYNIKVIGNYLSMNIYEFLLKIQANKINLLYITDIFGIILIIYKYILFIKNIT